MSDWRNDPQWQLAEIDAAWWEERRETPPAKPPPQAERAQPPIWASLYDPASQRIVATWFLKSEPTVTSADSDATLIA